MTVRDAINTALAEVCMPFLDFNALCSSSP